MRSGAGGHWNRGVSVAMPMNLTARVRDYPWQQQLWEREFGKDLFCNPGRRRRERARGLSVERHAL